MCKTQMDEIIRQIELLTDPSEIKIIKEKCDNILYFHKMKMTEESLKKISNELIQEYTNKKIWSSVIESLKVTNIECEMADYIINESCDFSMRIKNKKIKISRNENGDHESPRVYIEINISGKIITIEDYHFEKELNDVCDTLDIKTNKMRNNVKEYFKAILFDNYHWWRYCRNNKQEKI